MGGAVSAVGSAVGSVGGLFGNSSQAGILGTGQYQGGQYNVDQNAYYNQDANNALQSQFAQQMAANQSQQAPTVAAAQVDPTQQAQFRDAQTGLLGQLEAQSQGQGPSLANQQLQAGTQANIRSAMAQGTTGYGVNPALAQRNILQAAGTANQQAAQQAAMNRTQEQLNAQQQLAGLANQGRTSDIGMATTNADLSQQAGLANQQSQLTTNNQQNQMTQFLDSGQNTINQNNAASQQAYQQLKANQASGVNSVNEDAYKSASANRGNMVSKIGQAVGSLAHGGIVGMAAGGVADQTNTGPLSHFSGQAYGDSGDTPKKKADDPITAASSEATAGGGDGGDEPPSSMTAFGGELVPGKAKVAGDSLQNDTVLRRLSPGEIVLPRTVAKHALANEDSDVLKNFISGLKEKYKGKDLEDMHHQEMATALKNYVGKAG